MLIDEVMTSPVVVVQPETPVKEVATLLVTNGFGAVPVTGADGHLIGIITEADLIALEMAPDPRLHVRRDLPDPDLPDPDLPDPDLPDEASQARTAADVMTRPVIAARTGADISDVIRIMRSEHVTRMPVLDDHNRLVGLVSRSDLLKPLVRPDSAIESDIRRLVGYLDQPVAINVQVRAGEVTLGSPTGGTPPLFDHLIRAVPGVISLHHAASQD
jgi:CBS domain-containing protein